MCSVLPRVGTRTRPSLVVRLAHVLCLPVFSRDEGAPAQDKPLTDDDIETNWSECIETFDAMELREELLRGIYAYGFEKPSAIQQVCSACFI